MRRWTMIIMALGLSLALLSGACAPAAPKNPADFYAQKTVTLTVISKPGGGGDFAARLLASYWTEATGGTMVVKNITGAGGLLGINHVYNSKPDGLTIGTADFGGQMLGAWLFKRPGVEFDIEKFTWLSVCLADPYGFVVGANLPYKSAEDVRGVEGFKFATVTVDGTEVVACMLIAEALDMKDVRIIPGYKGTSPIGLALAQGEVDGATFNNGANIAFIQKGFAKPPLVTLWPERVEPFPDTPTLAEVVKLSPEEEAMLRIFYALKSAKVFYAPPGVDAAKVEFMRNAIDQVLDMAGFQRQIALRFTVWFEPTKGADVAAEIEKLLVIPEEDVALVNQMFAKYVK